MSQVTCPRCGSSDVRRAPSIALVIFGLAVILNFFGIFFFPLLFLGALCLAVTVALWILQSFPKYRHLKWGWQCQKCRKNFTQVLDLKEVS